MKRLIITALGIIILMATPGMGEAGDIQGPAHQSFTDNGDGTVTDNITGLMWQQRSDGIERQWASALGYCDRLTFGGHSGWSLPTMMKLESLVKLYPDRGPMINTKYFPRLEGIFWSSETYEKDVNAARGVDFSGGTRINKHKEGETYALCVRRVP